MRPVCRYGRMNQRSEGCICPRCAGEPHLSAESTSQVQFSRLVRTIIRHSSYCLRANHRLLCQHHSKNMPVTTTVEQMEFICSADIFSTVAAVSSAGSSGSSAAGLVMVVAAYGTDRAVSSSSPAYLTILPDSFASQPSPNTRVATYSITSELPEHPSHAQACLRDASLGTGRAFTMVGAGMERRIKYCNARPRVTGDFHGQPPILWTAGTPFK